MECLPHIEHAAISISSVGASDFERFAVLARDHRIAPTTVGVPHPHTIEFARLWMSTRSLELDFIPSLRWTVLRVCDDRLMGYAGLHKIDLERGQAELQFWVGYGVERNRDAIEWATAMLKFTSTTLDLKRLYALQPDRHPLASSALLSIGMRREGLVRKRLYRNGQVEDLVVWAVYGVTNGRINSSRDCEHLLDV